MSKSYVKIGKGAKLVSEGELNYITFDCLDGYNKKIVHCMSTRKGGISTNEFSSLNLGLNNSDDRNCVIQNFEILTSSLNIDLNSVVSSRQIHEDKLRIVKHEDITSGFIAENKFTGYDGLITNEQGITLVTFHADCVPVFIYDPVKNVIALVHSGWRSTLLEIANKAVSTMIKDFGSCSEDIIAVIGPSIRKCCFEVQKDVSDRFANKFDIHGSYETIESNRFTIDLQSIIIKSLLKSGILESNIQDCEICTKCNKELFFSHRGDSGKTGSLAAFMCIRS